MKDKFDPNKLKANALASIRLGVEDFTRSQNADACDQNRALSALRNLFAGILLLFKYRISAEAQNPADGYALIFKAGEVVPQPDGMGNFQWQPTKFGSTTIDVSDIKKRFDAFEIKTDWKVVAALQKERNNVEHLHPQAAAGVIGKFLSDTFPLLSAFIQDELHSAPAMLLGDAWATMLKHHDLFQVEAKACADAWAKCNVPADLLPVVAELQCESCNSSLIKPWLKEEQNVDLEDGEVKYACVRCGHQALIVPFLEEALVEFVGGYDPFSGDEPPTAECPECHYKTYVHSERKCFWCGMKLRRTSCERCGNGLTLDSYGSRFCGYCRYVDDKQRDD
ncbi:zinc ribbon domain-containing protein [Caballeronia grimmiae]|uniref:zinc ribbon domain-containing protein n=1 Tax=Caballeronia grimmiae TaxID=1071679 RepID=UPI0038B89A9A